MATLGWKAALCGAAISFGGCVAYNNPCSGLVENKDEEVGYLKGRVFLDKNNARHANNAIGRMAAEAFVEAFPDGEDKPEFGFLNGGAIRNEGGEELNGQCVTRNVIGQADDEKKPVPLRNGDIHQILLFENFVYAVNLTERELYQVMEHSVGALTYQPPDPAPPMDVVSPSGRFLHVSGRHGTDVAVSVDCSRTPAPDAPGTGRVTEIRIGNRVLSPNETTRTVRVAMPEFLLRGNDGYAILEPLRTDSTRNVIQSQVETGIDNDITAWWMKKTYGTEAAALVSHEADREVCASPASTSPSCVDGEAGITCCKSPLKLVGCAVPRIPE